METYPPAVLADLAVQLLAEASAGGFTPAAALGRGTATTRGGVSTVGCCITTNLEHLNQMGGNPFYFGRDADGYLVVTARTALPGWPLAKGKRPLPFRLTRWLLMAGTGQVVRHRCDERSCIRIDHLTVGTQRENLVDAIRRGRRRPDLAHGVQKALPPRAARARALSSSGARSSRC